MLHRARWGEKTGEIVVEIVQDGGGWLRHRLYLVPGVLLGGLEHYQELIVQAHPQESRCPGCARIFTRISKLAFVFIVLTYALAKFGWVCFWIF